jgi:hypothetical protein
LLARALGDAVVAAIRQARPDLSWPDPVFKDSLEYGEINFAKMPAVILEVGFHTNPADSTALQQDSFRQAVAKGIRDGLKTYLGDTGPPPVANWAAAPSSLSFTAGVVGGQSATASFTLSNTGTGGGTFGISSDNTVFSVSPQSEFLNSGAQKSIAVTAAPCTSTDPQTGKLSITSPGANTAVVNLSRTCAAPALPIPAPLVVSMSSNGRMLLSWPNVAGATAYGFSAWFDGVSIPVQGRALPKGGVYSSAVATFISNPAAAQKQGKQACFSVRSESSTQVSGFSPQACVEYRYYTNDIGIQGEGEQELRLGEW